MRSRSSTSAAVLVSTTVACGQTYWMTVLEPLNPAESSRALDISNTGRVVGISQSPIRPMVWDGGPPVQPMQLSISGFANRVNDAGQVCGGASGQGVIWTNGSLTTLTPRPGGIGAAAQDLNADGETVVGWSWTVAGAGDRQATLWRRESGVWQVMPLGTLGGVRSNAARLGHGGIVAGWAFDSAARYRASLWMPPTYSISELPNTLGGGNSEAWDVGSDGLVAGSAENASGSWRPAVWHAPAYSQTTELPLPPQFPNASVLSINGRGQMVGWGWSDINNWEEHPANRALLWDGPGVHDLNLLIPANSGWVLLGTRRINEAGQIAGWMRPASAPGPSRAFLLRPCTADCDRSGGLNIDDFTCFINAFAVANSLPHEQQVWHPANCDRSTVPPVLNVDDFMCFINYFAGGCD
jgi:uncharacterized membrane protein